jgi:ribose transport system substrate-binding protein
MKKIAFLAILILFASTQINAQEVKKDGIVIGFSNSSVANSWRVFMMANFKDEVALHPEISKVYYTNAEDKPYQQSRDILSLLEKEIDVLVVFPAVLDALNPAIEKAYSLGVPVIILGNKVSTGDYTTFIETSNYDMGKLQAQWLARELDYEGNIIMFSGAEHSGPAMDRLSGARDVFRKHPKIKILTHRFTNWSIELTRKVMKGLVKKFNNLDGVWADSGLMSWPVLEVLKEEGLPLVPSTGDQLNGYAKFLVNNNARGFIQPFPATQSRSAVIYAVKAAQGEKLPKYIKIPVESYGPEKIKKLVRMNKSDYWWIGDDQMSEEYLPKL